jgi:hypothetical protein
MNGKLVRISKEQSHMTNLKVPVIICFEELRKNDEKRQSG